MKMLMKDILQQLITCETSKVSLIIMLTCYNTLLGETC